MCHPIAQVDLNNYQFIKSLGSGNFGKVSLVKKKSTDEFFALKESYKEYSPDNANQDFEKEIFSLHKVQNPAIVKIYGLSLTDFHGEKHPVILLKYLINGSLDNVFEKNLKTLNPTKKLIIILGIALGMKSLHSHGIVHRDLKPNNILLDEKFYPYICDFGLSFITSSLEYSEILMETPTGTPLYQAPEIILGKKYSYKVDVYSFALVVYQLITGEKLNKKYASSYVMQKEMINGKRPDTSMIMNQRVKNFIELCWSGDHLQRPSFNDIVEEYLDAEYLSFFNANKKEVDAYLSLFDNELKTKDSTQKIVNTKINLAKAGDSFAYLELALIYESGKRGIEPNQEKACKYFEKACELNNLEAMIKYAQKLKDGIGIPKNKEKAKEIYRKFYELCDTNGMHHLIELVNIDNTENIHKETQKKTEKLFSEPINDEENDFSNFSVYIIRVTSPVFTELAQNMKIKITEKEKADIFIFDGIFSSSKYHLFDPSKYVNKIPGLSDICLKKNLFKSLIKIKNKFPSIYKSFIPMTFYLPEDIKKFKDTVTQYEYQNSIWVLRKNKRTLSGIKLISDPINYEENIDAIVQPFISPYLIHHHKFDLRFYLMITNLDPLTVYIYEDGLAYFCNERYSSHENISINACSFNKKRFVNDSGFELIRPISSIKKHFSNDNSIWKKIMKICSLIIISIYDQMKESAIKACEMNDEDYDNGIEKIPALNRFYNLIAIDFLIDKNQNPFVIDINDNPGTKPLNEFDRIFKQHLIKSEYELIASILNKPINNEKNWFQILPTDDQTIDYVFNNLNRMNCGKKKKSDFKPVVTYI